MQICQQKNFWPKDIFHQSIRILIDSVWWQTLTIQVDQSLTKKIDKEELWTPSLYLELIEI